MDYLSSGFYKNKILFKFLCSQNEKYFHYENNYKYKDIYKDKNYSKNNFNFEPKNKKKNNLINLFFLLLIIKKPINWMIFLEII